MSIVLACGARLPKAQSGMSQGAALSGWSSWRGLLGEADCEDLGLSDLRHCQCQNETGRCYGEEAWLMLRGEGVGTALGDVGR